MDHLYIYFKGKNNRQAWINAGETNKILPLLQNSLNGHENFTHLFGPSINIFYDSNHYVSSYIKWMSYQECFNILDPLKSGFQTCNEGWYNIASTMPIDNITDFCINFWEYTLKIPLTPQNNANDTLFYYQSNSFKDFPDDLFYGGYCNQCKA